MVEEEQKWPTTAMALSWSTRRLATGHGLLRFAASSALTSLIFSPLIPPAALMSSAAWDAPRQYCSPKEALAPVCRSGHADHDVGQRMRGKTHHG